jgi:peroxiredoxin
MTAASPPLVNFGWRAPDFRLADTRGKIWTLGTLRGSKGLLVMFICNHCPYVLAVIDKLAKEGRQLRDMGFGVAAVCSNDAAAYPEDSYDKMGAFARRHSLAFPYLHDVNQTAARAYGAVCTPDFFGFNAELQLQYRGRLDDSGPSPHPGARRELFEAMRQIADTGQGPREQMPAIGCSIKWKAA